jgi:hypothetical protein
VALSFRDEIDKMVNNTKMSVHIRIGNKRLNKYRSYTKAISISRIMG